jgi:hypothetical protein
VENVEKGEVMGSLATSVLILAFPYR